VDQYPHHLWVFLFANKSPPIDTITNFLTIHGRKSGRRYIRTDQGGELAKSIAFLRSALAADYTLEITGAGASFQNAIAEQPHRTLAEIMRTMLTGANLDSSYWSHAFRHAVYIKNHLTHSALPDHTTPFQPFIGR